MYMHDSSSAKCLLTDLNNLQFSFCWYIWENLTLHDEKIKNSLANSEVVVNAEQQMLNPPDLMWAYVSAPSFLS